MYEPLTVSGYVLAGGRSTRMGRDKALLELAGKPLVEHALIKLRRICGEVAILSNEAELERFGPVVRDLYPGCGPMSGLEAALAHAGQDWSLVLPVDVPFVPTKMLYSWAQATVRHGERYGTRVAMFEVGGIPQPALVMLHREVAPYLRDALAAGRYKLFPELKVAAAALGAGRGLAAEAVLRRWAWTEESRFEASMPAESLGPAWARIPGEHEGQAHRYFANLNTPGELLEAEAYANLLDT